MHPVETRFLHGETGSGRCSRVIFGVGIWRRQVFLRPFIAGLLGIL